MAERQSVNDDDELLVREQGLDGLEKGDLLLDGVSTGFRNIDKIQNGAG